MNNISLNNVILIIPYLVYIYLYKSKLLHVVGVAVSHPAPTRLFELLASAGTPSVGGRRANLVGGKERSGYSLRLVNAPGQLADPLHLLRV